MREDEIRLIRRVRAVGPAALLVLASFAVALVAATAGSAAPNRFDMGVYDPTANQTGGGSAYSTLSAGIAMRRTKQAGSRFVRIPIRWDRVVCSAADEACLQSNRPADATDPNDGAYAWARSGWYDYPAEVQAALTQGLEPVLSVFGIPAFAECNGTGGRSAALAGEDVGRLISCPGRTGQFDEANYRPNPPDYADFMAALSARFPRVHYFQVLNEPNFSVFLQPARSWQTISYYRRLVNQTYDALHQLGAAGSGDYVIAGGTSPNPRSGPTIKAIAPKAFAERLVRSAVKFDIYDTHPYTQGGPKTSAPPGFGAIWMGDLWRVDRILKQAKRKGKIQGRPLQFWAGEFGWDSAPPDCLRLHKSSAHPSWGLHRAVPGGLLRRWVSESAYRMWRQGVSVMIWGQLKDFPLQENPHQGGLYRWGGNGRVGRAKSALQAFRFPFVAYARRGGVYVWGRRPNSEPGRVTIQRRVRGEWRKIKTVRARSGKNGLFSARLHFEKRWRVKVLRARVPATGQKSAPFALKAPRTPVGILPFGCDSTSRPA